MHGRAGYACVGYACVAEPEQRSALNRCTCQKLASRVGSAPVARRGAPAAAAPSGRSASNVHKSPTQSTPGLSAQFLRTHHRRVRRGSFYAAGEHRSRAPLRTPSSPLQRGSATTAHDAAATAGLTVLTSSCSVADAAAAPSFDSARRHEAADRAQTATTALLDLRSVSQWVRRVYQPELRRKTDRSLSSPATAICILHVCESRPHAARCACEVHGMKCGWRARV